MAAPVVVALDDAEGAAIVEACRRSGERTSSPARPSRWRTRSARTSTPGSPGFTFNNSVYRTPEQIGAIGELLRLL